MNLSEIKQAYRIFGWRDFCQRAMRRILEPIVPLLSYAQVGEDIIVESLLFSVGIRFPTYLEIGTNHPKHGNNTYKLYRKGCRGVLVEADPSLIPLIRRVRPKDKILNVGVGEKGGHSSQFFVFTQSAINTFDPKEAEIRKNQGETLKCVVDVPIQTINSILSENFKTVPDFLSLDIEGLDLSVLKTLDVYAYPIPIICVETCLFSQTHIKDTDTEIISFMESVGYFVYATTYINTIFVNKAWFNQNCALGENE